MVEFLLLAAVIDLKNDVFISKNLSWLLRHGAIKEGLPLSSDGFIPVVEILKSRRLKKTCTSDDIVRVVANSDKQRFALRTTSSGVLEIRANQGHSIKEVSDLELLAIDDPTKYKNVIHGTYYKFWSSIKVHGLSRGRRNHIHFALSLPGKTSEISGIRKSAEIYVYIDLPKAIAAGLLFYLSSNNVVLSPGNDEGYIKPEFFMDVCSSNGEVLL